MEDAKPKLLCLQETRVCDQGLIDDRVKSQMRKWFPKDLQYWSCSKPPKLGYSGTAILISKDFEGGRPDKVEYDGFGEEGLHD